MRPAKLVLPGGIDSHCHIEQRSSAGIVCADDFYSATVAAAFGGTTTVIPFAAQHRGQSLRQVVEEYHEAARPKAVIDYAFHLIISDPTEQVMGQELPALIRDGYTSFKVYMTYDLLQLDDAADARHPGPGAARGRPCHGSCRELRHDQMADRAAVSTAVSARRAITRSAMPGSPRARRRTAPSVWRSSSTCRSSWSMSRPPRRSRSIRNAQTKGLRIYGETCPQYLFLTADDLARPGLEGAKFCCSPPPRDQEATRGGVERPEERYLSGVFVRPRPLSL